MLLSVKIDFLEIFQQNCMLFKARVSQKSGKYYWNEGLISLKYSH